MTEKALVEIFAKQFHGGPIAHAPVTDIPTGRTWLTGSDGYAMIEAEVGRRLTMLFHPDGFPAVQTATVVVPPEGLTGENRELTFEVPGKALYNTLLFLFGKAKKDTRHIVTTVLSAESNLHHNFGEAGAHVALVSQDGTRREDPIYLAASLDGKGGHNTSWPSAIIERRLRQIFGRHAPRVAPAAATVDGGLFFTDVPYGDYKIVAEKEGMSFSESRVTVLPQSPRLINASPPHGPKAQPI